MPSLVKRLKRGGKSADQSESDAPQLTIMNHVTAIDWVGSRPTLAFLHLLRKALEGASGSGVVLVAGQQADAWQELFARAWPDVALTVVRLGEDPAAIHVRLTAAGPFDVVMQAADTSGLDQSRLFQSVFMHLREGGTYLTPRLVPLQPEDVARAAAADAGERLQREDGPREPPYVGDLWKMVSAAQAARIRDFDDHMDVGLAFRDIRGLGRHLLQTRVFSKILVIKTEKASWPKLNEAETNALLAVRREIGEVAHTVAGATLVATKPVVHTLGEDPYFSSHTPAPELTLRAYRKPVCSRGQVVASHGIILPDTFRFPLSPRMTNIYVEESAPRFGFVRRDISDPVPLPGVWFHLDSEWPGQFGHMITERLSRLWAWERVKREHPEARILITPHDKPPFELHQFELDLFDALGISASDVHEFEEPCEPELLYSATPMFSLSEYVHPRIADVWRKAGDALASRADPGPRPERLFFTRPMDLKRACHNTPEVERLFERHGFTVMRPEKHPLSDQVAMVRAAEAVGGFVGSGLFTTALRPTPTKVFTVGPTSYTARNEQLIAAVHGHEVVAAWSKPDISHPPGEWTNDAFFSGFTCDMEDEGGFLDEQLDLLGGRP